MTKIRIMDPANPGRDGWHSITDINGQYQDSLNGNIKRIFFTGVPQSLGTSSARQPDDWSCGPHAIAEALNHSNGEAERKWLLQRGLITSSYGTEHYGIIKCLNAYGYTCSVSDGYINGQMNPSVLKQLISHLKSGYKVILLMGGLKSNAGGACRNSYWSNAGHYVCAYGINEETSTTTITSSSTTWKTIGTATCTDNSVNVRRSPGGTILGQLNKGNRFEVNGKTSGDWVNIKVSGIGEGWMSKQYIKYDGSTSINSSAASSSTAKSSYSFNPDQVKIGSNNKSVLLLQCILKAKGLYNSSLDGIFGSGSDSAVKTYQKQNNLTVDGICGPATWKSLLKI